VGGRWTWKDDSEVKVGFEQCYMTEFVERSPDGYSSAQRSATHTSATKTHGACSSESLLSIPSVFVSTRGFKNSGRRVALRTNEQAKCGYREVTSGGGGVLDMRG